MDKKIAEGLENQLLIGLQELGKICLDFSVGIRCCSWREKLQKHYKNITLNQNLEQQIGKGEKLEQQNSKTQIRCMKMRIMITKFL